MTGLDHDKGQVSTLFSKIKALITCKDDNRFTGKAQKNNQTINNSSVRAQTDTHSHTHGERERELLILDCETGLMGGSLSPMAHTVLTGSL